MQTGCNKQIKAHNDLCYSDNDVQLSNDYVCPILPTATFTIGGLRAVPFERMTKEYNGDVPSSKWQKSCC